MVRLNLCNEGFTDFGDFNQESFKSFILCHCNFFRLDVLSKEENKNENCVRRWDLKMTVGHQFTNN